MSEHGEKLKLAGVARFGSEKAWREHLRQSSNKSARNTGGQGGFAALKKSDPEKLKAIARAGAEARHNGPRTSQTTQT